MEGEISSPAMQWGYMSEYGSQKQNCEEMIEIDIKTHSWRKTGEMLYRGVQTLGFSGPHWKNKSCLGPHIKYTNTNEN